jgi:hypothetical protein
MPLRDGLRSAAFSCRFRFPSTSFNREVEGKLHDGPSSLLRRDSHLLTLQPSVEFPLVPAVEQGPRGTTKIREFREAPSVAERPHGACHGRSMSLANRGQASSRGVTRDPRSRTTRSGWEQATGSRRRHHFPAASAQRIPNSPGFKSTGEIRCQRAAQLGTPSLKHRAGNHSARSFSLSPVAAPGNSLNSRFVLLSNQKDRSVPAYPIHVRENHPPDLRDIIRDSLNEGHTRGPGHEGMFERNPDTAPALAPSPCGRGSG